MGEEASRVAISGFFTISDSFCSAFSMPVGCGGTGSERVGGWRARKDANTRLAIDADSGTTPRQPCPPGPCLSVHTRGELRVYVPLMKYSLAPSFALTSCSCMMNAPSGGTTSFESPFEKRRLC